MESKVLEILKIKIKKKEVKEFDFINVFPHLNHKEHHFSKYPKHPWFKSEHLIKDWLERYAGIHSSEYVIHNDFTVSFEGDVLIENKKIKFLPFQFRSVKNLNVSNNKLSSLIGTPYRCHSLNAENNNLVSFLGVGKHIDFLYVDNNKIKNFNHFKGDDVNVNYLSVYLNPIKEVLGISKNLETLIYWNDKEGLDVDYYNLALQLPNNIKYFNIKEEIKNINKGSEYLITETKLEDVKKDYQKLVNSFIRSKNIRFLIK